MRRIVEDTEALLPPGAWPAWTGSNHDMSRFASRWADGDPRKARAALLMLLCLRGTPVLYQGDEIGLGDAPVAKDDLRDPLGVRYWPAYAGRDAMRTPMPWRDVPGGGFTDPGDATLAPAGADRGMQRGGRNGPTPGPCSPWLGISSPCAGLTPALQTGSYETMAAPEGVWAWRRGTGVVVALNMNDHGVTLEGTRGHIRVGTDRARDGEDFDDRLTLRGWEAVVAETT